MKDILLKSKSKLKNFCSLAFALFKKFLLNTRFKPKFLDFLKWVLIDIYRIIKYGRKTHVYGIWCFVGVYGGGKTMSMVHYLEQMRKKHKDNIYIATNFFYKHQDFEIRHWRDLLNNYDRSVIFAYDELQNEFNSRDYKNFPYDLMHMLTQNRKGNGRQIVYTTQDYTTVDTIFRKQTKTVVTCRTFLGRLTRCRYYPKEQYENLIATADISRKVKMRLYHTESFVQTDELRSLYDSFKMIETSKQKEYIDRNERRII